MKINDLITESSLGYSDAYHSFSNEGKLAFAKNKLPGLYKFMQSKFPQDMGFATFDMFKEDWKRWIEEEGDINDALDSFLSFYFETYYPQHSDTFKQQAQQKLDQKVSRSRLDAEAGGGGGGGAGGGAGSGAGAGTGGGAGPGNSSGGGAHGSSSGMGGSAGSGDTGSSDSTPSAPAGFYGLGTMPSGKRKKKKKKKKSHFKFGGGIYKELNDLEPCPKTKSKGCQCSKLSEISEADETVKAICSLEHTEGNVKGVIKFKQKPGKATIIKGIVKGLTPGKHGFHIHEFGDLSKGCESAGAHYNPDGVDHGSLQQGHVGDLGNIVADKSGTARFQIKAERVELSDVVGRAIVIHADEDDLGKGGDEESLKTGNAGERVGCGVIRLRKVVEEKYKRKISDKHFDRNQLPQIRRDDLEISPFTFSEGEILTSLIKPVQSQRVEGLAEDAENGFFDDDYRPLILDKDNYLVNGHHRLDAAHVLGLYEVNAIQVDATLEELMKHFEHKISYDKVVESKINSNDMRAKEFLYLKFKKWLVEADLAEQMFGINEYDILDMFIGSDNVDHIFGSVRRGTPDFKFEGIRNLKMYLKKKGIWDENRGSGLVYKNINFNRINPAKLNQNKLSNLLTFATKLSENTNSITEAGEKLKGIITTVTNPSSTQMQTVTQLQNQMVTLKGQQIKMVDGMDNLIKSVFGISVA